jgi:hypothetical protein
MNIFYTNEDPIICASEHCRVHRVKMILEYCQLLSIAHHVVDGENAPKEIYKRTHENHPSAIWIRKSIENYNWVLNCAMTLISFHRQHTGKIHKSSLVLEKLKSPPKGIAIEKFCPPVQCMPEEFKSDCSILSYQEYLKSKFDEWSKRTRPIRAEFDFGTPSWRV